MSVFGLRTSNTANQPVHKEPTIYSESFTVPTKHMPRSWLCVSCVIDAISDTLIVRRAAEPPNKLYCQLTTPIPVVTVHTATKATTERLPIHMLCVWLGWGIFFFCGLERNGSGWTSKVNWKIVLECKSVWCRFIDVSDLLNVYSWCLTYIAPPY